jgi:predicted transcriptional regulator
MPSVWPIAIAIRFVEAVQLPWKRVEDLPAMSAKQLVIKTVRALPDDSTMAQIAEEVAILAAIERGEADIAAGRTISHEEVVKRVRPWETTK